MRLASLCLALFPACAQAHPHEFVEAALALHLDARGYLVAIDVTWRYDPFTTMLILSDLGLDPAAIDLPPERAPQLQGFDMDWIEGYNGDIWPTFDGVEIALAPPVAGAAEVIDGQVVSRHRRALTDPVDPRTGDLRLRVFDPEFYVAYTIAVPVEVSGASNCIARVFGPDLEAAQAHLAAALDELSGSVDIELNFPLVGEHFADEVVVSCSLSQS